ncbi:Endonuclease I [Flavobacterium haoranii]|uniref:Endonuclease I n=1 Tax=Flavobacterium haoranii TaxID=683124 RepID=A0A1M6E348_9FLAO|nr:Endonuclease I [Flavobacterium haoranii]
MPYTSSSPDVWDALQAGDVTPNDASKVFLIYGFDDFDAAYKNDRTDIVTNICSSSCPTGAWNREHTYALSLGTPALVTSSPGPGTDAHHIRAADVTFNADRGNRLYADGEGDAGPVSTFWYPGDEWKGDIARMMMYMYVRYDSSCLANNVGSGGNTYHVDMPDIFLEWNEEDPVSDFERTRNNVIQSFQGNRNPFIDNPYFATLIWGGPQAPDTWNTISCSAVTTWNGSSWNNGTPNKDVRAI